LQPDWVINAAAYTNVERAESEEKLAHTVNAEAPGVMAQWCAANSVPFVSYSTDYVHGGEGTEFQDELTATHALNAYGRTKLAGEKAIAAAGGKWMIFRTSWVYAETGKNFLRTIIKLGLEREEIKVVDDQWGAPTYAVDIAEATVQAMKNSDFKSGIYNM